VNYVEVTRLHLDRARDGSRSACAQPEPARAAVAADELLASASYVTFVRRDAPAAGGTGALVWIPPTAASRRCRVGVLNLPFPCADDRAEAGDVARRRLLGRRNALALSWATSARSRFIRSITSIATGIPLASRASTRD
jgi:hypothetical protein